VSRYPQPGGSFQYTENNRHRTYPNESPEAFARRVARSNNQQARRGNRNPQPQNNPATGPDNKKPEVKPEAQPVLTETTFLCDKPLPRNEQILGQFIPDTPSDVREQIFPQGNVNISSIQAGQLGGSSVQASQFGAGHLGGHFGGQFGGGHFGGQFGIQAPPGLNQDTVTQKPAGSKLGESVPDNARATRSTLGDGGKTKEPTFGVIGDRRKGKQPIPTNNLDDSMRAGGSLGGPLGGSTLPQATPLHPFGPAQAAANDATSSSNWTQINGPPGFSIWSASGKEAEKMSSGPGFDAWHSFRDITNTPEAPMAAGKAMILNYPALGPQEIADMLKIPSYEEMVMGPEFPTWDNPRGFAPGKPSTSHDVPSTAPGESSTSHGEPSKTGSAFPTNRPVGKQGDGGYQKMGAFQFQKPFNSDKTSFPAGGQTGGSSKNPGPSNMTEEEPVPKFEGIEGVEIPSGNPPPTGWVVGRNVFGQPVTISDKGLSAPIFNPNTGKALLGGPLRTMPIKKDIKGSGEANSSKPTAYALVSEGFKVEDRVKGERQQDFAESKPKFDYNPEGFPPTDIRHPAFPGYLFKLPPWLVPQKPVEREDGGFHIGVFDHPASGVFGATPGWPQPKIPCGPDGGVPWPNCPKPPPPNKMGPQAGDPDYKYRDGIVYDVSTGFTRFETDDEIKARCAAKRAAEGLPPVAKARPWWDTDAYRGMEADAARDAGVPEALNMLRAMGLEDTVRKFHPFLVDLL
jgi:hypothetical protein